MKKILSVLAVLITLVTCVFARDYFSVDLFNDGSCIYDYVAFRNTKEFMREGTKGLMEIAGMSRDSANTVMDCLGLFEWHENPILAEGVKAEMTKGNFEYSITTSGSNLIINRKIGDRYYYKMLIR